MRQHTWVVGVLGHGAVDALCAGEVGAGAGAPLHAEVVAGLPPS